MSEVKVKLHGMFVVLQSLCGWLLLLLPPLSPSVHF